MSGEEEEVGEMTLAVRQLTETLEDLLQYGRDSVQESKEEFINGKIGKLFGMSFAYEKCYNRLHVSTKEGLERKIHRFSRDRDLREASSDLLDVEQDWDTFLQGVDKSLEGKTEDTVQVGETGPLKFPLVDARSGEATSLQEYVGKGTSPDEVTSNGGRVIVVSFGLQEGAKKWLEDTACPFPMLLDSERKVYHAFGLKRSVFKVWGVNSLVYYTEAMVARRPLPKPYENVHDDTQQMGGDFILDPEGNAAFLYPSKTNTDRPSVDMIVTELQKIQSSQK